MIIPLFTSDRKGKVRLYGEAIIDSFTQEETRTLKNILEVCYVTITSHAQ